MIARRARCRAVMSSELIRDDLVQDGSELLEEGLAVGGTAPVPDRRGSNGHSPSSSLANCTQSVTASRASLGGWGDDRRHEVGGRQRAAPAPILAADPEHNAWGVRRGRDAEQRKAAAAQRMSRIGDLDFGQRLVSRVVEGGIEWGDRSTGSIMTG